MMTKHYIPEYPRPQFVRENWTLLNGRWDFAFDDDNCGEKAYWYRSAPQGRHIQVPYTYEAPAGGIGDSSAHSVVWYFRTLELQPTTDIREILHFEGSDYITKVWLNGVFLGKHTGGYTRFSFDLTNAAKIGENLLAVRVEDSFSTAQPRGKQRWTGENFGCWYIQTTGIWKSVWLEHVPVTHLRAVKMTPLYDEESVSIAYSVEKAKAALVEMETVITFGDKKVLRTRQEVGAADFCHTYDLRSPDMLWKVELWHPGAPNLYDVAFHVYADGVLVDSVYSYFGMRKIECADGRLKLNNNPLYLRMVLDQGYWPETHLTPPSEEALIDDIEKTLSMGFNGVRKHQKVEDERWLYWCDVKGVLVWHEMPSAYEYTDAAASAFLAEWEAAVRQHYNHTCIITWVPLNESWGIPQVCANREQQLFTEAVYAVTKMYDGTRPVIVNDGWEHTVSDIVTLHDYDSSGEGLKHRYRNGLAEILTNAVSHNGYKYAFAKGYAYRGQPLLITEYGGVAIAGETGWGYNDKAKDKKECLARIADLTVAIYSMDAVCGFCYTQLTDTQQEVNGLLDAMHDPKFPIAEVRRIICGTADD